MNVYRIILLSKYTSVQRASSVPLSLCKSFFTGDFVLSLSRSPNINKVLSNIAFKDLKLGEEILLDYKTKILPIN